MTRLMKWIMRQAEPRDISAPNQQLFTDETIWKLILPLFAEQLLAMLVGIADSFMVSYAGEAAVSGVSLVNMLFTVFIYLFTSLTSGGAVVISQYVGSKNREKANRSAGQLLMSSFTMSLLLMAICLLWPSPILGTLFGKVDPDVMDACQTYLRISAYSLPALAIYNSGVSVLRSIEDTQTAMKVSVICNAINMVGNAIGIFILHAGVAGVAWPSFIARTFSAVAISLACCSSKKTIRYQFKHILSFDKDLLHRILKVALPNGIESGVFQLIKVSLSSITARFGTIQIAANGVAQSFWSLAALVGVAMGPAYITVVGQCVGSEDRDAANYYFMKLHRLSTALSILWNLMILLITPLMMHFYPLSSETIRLVILLVLIHNIFNALLFPISGALSSGLRAAGDVRFTMILSILSTIFCRLLLSVVFGIWMNLGVIGIALAMCCDWGVRAFFCWNRYKSGKWRHFRLI